MVAGMETSSGLPYRRSVRLKGWIYRDGIFFITICTHETRCTLGRVENDRIVLSPLGEIVQNEWLRSNVLRPGLVIDDYVIMPNHMHALVSSPQRSAPSSADSRALSRGVPGIPFGNGITTSTSSATSAS